MLKTIATKNFRGFREISVDLNRISVVMGPNSSGKTSLLQAVQLAMAALDLAIASNETAQVSNHTNRQISLCRDLFISDHTVLLPLDDWPSLFFNRQTDKNSFFEIALSFDQEDPIRGILIRVKCASNNQIKLEVDIDAPLAVEMVSGRNKKSPQINKNLIDYLEANKPSAVFIPSFYGIIRQEEYRARPVLDRELRAGEQGRIVRNLLYRLDDDAFHRLKKFLLRHIQTDLIKARSEHR